MCIVVADGWSMLNFASTIKQATLSDRGLDSTNLDSWSDHFSRLHHFPFFKMALLLMEQMGQGFSMREDFGKERPPLPPYICSS